MDDLALLTEMGDRTPLPAAKDLAPARARLMSAIDESPKYVTDVAMRTPRRGRRLAWSAAGVVGLAAALTAVFALGGFGVAPPKASAAEVLQDAAAYARSLPDTPPRPDQFMYSKDMIGDGTFTEAWRSADGTRDGQFIYHGETQVTEGCKDGKRQAYREADPIPGVFEPCEPMPAYDPDLPTDVAAMLDYLETEHSATPDNVNDFAKTVWERISGSYAQPQSLAALFEVLAQTDGLTIVENAADVSGRQGVGVSWTNNPGEDPVTLVFDAETHALLGDTRWTAHLVTGYVDEVGQRP